MMGANIREHRSGVVGLTFSPVIVAANTTAEQTLTVPGLRPGDITVVQKPVAQAGLGIVGSRVSALDTLAVTFVNATGVGITPTPAQAYLIFWFRPELVSTAAQT